MRVSSVYLVSTWANTFELIGKFLVFDCKWPALQTKWVDGFFSEWIRAWPSDWRNEWQKIAARNTVGVASETRIEYCMYIIVSRNNMSWFAHTETSNVFQVSQLSIYSAGPVTSDRPENYPTPTQRFGSATCTCHRFASADKLCTSVCFCVCPYACTHLYMSMCVHHVCPCTCVYVVYQCLSLCVCPSAYVCMFLCMYIYIYTYIHTYILCNATKCDVMQCDMMWCDGL